MKKLRILTLILGLAVLGSANAVYAEEPAVTTAPEVTTAENSETVIEANDAEKCEKTIFIGDEILNNEKCVEKNAFVTGMTLTDNSRVGGLSFMAGNSLELGGSYNYGFVAGNTVKITGHYDGDLFVAGNIVEITNTAVIEGDIYAAGNIVTIATEANDVYVAANKVRIEANVNGDLRTGASQLIVVEGNKVVGTAYYNSDATLSAAEDFAGAVEIYTEEQVNITYNFGTEVYSTCFTIAGFAVVLLFAILLMPGAFKKLDEMRKTKNFQEGIIDAIRGIGVMIGLPVIAILLLLSLIGIIGAGATLLLYGLVLLLAIPFAGYYVGGWLVKEKKDEKFLQKFGRGVAGVAVIQIIGLIPYVGGVVIFIAMLFGLGLIWDMTLKKKQA